MMDPSASSKTLPDGVYFGVNIPDVNGKSIPHPWMEVIDKGRSKTFEYGPKSDQYGGLGSPMVEKHPDYGDNHSNAGALFAISPPAGMSQEKFIDRALALGNNLDGVLKSEYVPYVPGLVADCDSAALALFLNLGGSPLQFEQMTMSATAGTAFSHAFTDVGGLSFGPSEVPLAVQLWTTLPSPSVVGIPYPGAGTISISQVDLKLPELAPAPIPGTAPPTADQLTRETMARRQSTGVAPTANEIEPRIASEPTPYAALKTTEMTSAQIELYVDIRKEAREVFAGVLGKTAPTVSVERNGITSDQERFSNSIGQIVGLDDGKLIQQSASGHRTTFDYGDLLVNAKNPVAFDTMARQALSTGEPMNLSMQQGQASIIAQPAFEQQQTLQRGVAELSLGRSHER